MISRSELFLMNPIKSVFLSTRLKKPRKKPFVVFFYSVNGWNSEKTGVVWLIFLTDFGYGKTIQVLSPKDGAMSL